MLSYCITKYHLNIHTAIHKLKLEALIRYHRTEQRQGLYSNEIQTTITSQVMKDFAWNKCTGLRAASLTPELQPDARTRNRCNSFVQNQLIRLDTATHEETLKLASFFLYKQTASYSEMNANHKYKIYEETTILDITRQHKLHRYETPKHDLTTSTRLVKRGRCCQVRQCSTSGRPRSYRQSSSETSSREPRYGTSSRGSYEQNRRYSMSSIIHVPRWKR